MLGLEHIGENRAPLRTGEVLHIADGRAAVHARVVAARGLHGGRQLEQVRIPRLHLRLHQEMQDAVELFRQNSQDAHLGLPDDRLVPFREKSGRGTDMKPLDREEAPRTVHQISGTRGEVPALEVRERDLVHGECVLPVPPGEPLREIGRRHVDAPAAYFGRPRQKSRGPTVPAGARPARAVTRPPAAQPRAHCHCRCGHSAEATEFTHPYSPPNYPWNERGNRPGETEGRGYCSGVFRDCHILAIFLYGSR